MKNFYILVNYEENGKYYPYIIKTSKSNNLLSALNQKGLITANIIPTLKEARTTCEAWRKAYKENGTYLF